MEILLLAETFKEYPGWNIAQKTPKKQQQLTNE